MPRRHSISRQSGNPFFIAFVTFFASNASASNLSPAEVAKAGKSQMAAIPGVGNWYRGTVCGEEMIGWLCPALFHYFTEAPQKIYAKAEPLPAGIDPIWHVNADDPKAKRYVSASGEM